jgi:hypothetical protein
MSEFKRSVIKPEKLMSWLPVDAVVDDGRPAISWMDFSEVVLTEPFFHETVARISAALNRQIVITDLDALLQLEKISDHLQPSGFIFHSSRCGSTLVANGCRALNGSIVMSEALVIDKLLSRFFTDAEPNSAKELLYMVLVRAAIRALGQRRLGNERYFFVKFACTSSLQMNRIQKIFPDVPAVFLYRDPVEVMVSNLRSIPDWMRPESNPATAAAIAGVELSQLSELSAEEFCAKALGRFYAEADKNRGPKLMVLNYDQLTPERLLGIVRSFGIEPTKEEADAITYASRLYSKDLTRSQTFVADSDSKRNAASAFIRQMAEKWAIPSYERLNVTR